MEKLHAPMGVMILGFVLILAGCLLSRSLWSVVSALGGGAYMAGYIVLRFRQARQRR